MAISYHLVAAYRATTYWVMSPHGSFTLRIGARHELFDAPLQSVGVKEWAFVTACNPRSQQLSESENVRRHAQLAAEVRTLGYEAWPGNSVGDDTSWPPETSLLILNVPRDTAITLARRYDQNAIVVGRIGEEAELVIVDV